MREPRLDQAHGQQRMGGPARILGGGGGGPTHAGAGIGRVDGLAALAARPHLGAHRRVARALDEVGAGQLTLGEVHEHAEPVLRLARVHRHHARPGGEGGGVHAHDVQPRPDVGEVVLALGVGDRERAVLEVDPHARHPDLLGALDAVRAAAAGGVDLADQDALVAEHPAVPPDEGFNPHGISVRPS